jgi:hypothetical protein
MRREIATGALLVVCVTAVAACGSTRVSPDMTFFVTSVPAGQGGDMGGLKGADAHCRMLAEAAGATAREWRAYLSAAAEGGAPAVNARDRIGRGPWLNAAGVQIAASLDDLHGPGNNLRADTALNDEGEAVGYFHDMMTGSDPDGTLASGDATCRNWTSTSGRAIVGHSNKQGSCCGGRAQS